MCDVVRTSWGPIGVNLLESQLQVWTKLESEGCKLIISLGLGSNNL